MQQGRTNILLSDYLGVSDWPRCSAFMQDIFAPNAITHSDLPSSSPQLNSSSSHLPRYNNTIWYPFAFTQLTLAAMSSSQHVVDPALHAEDESASWVSRDKFLGLHEAHNKLHELQNDTVQRLNKLEQRVEDMDSNSGSDTDSDAESEFWDANDDYQLGFEELTIPEAREVDYNHFKNRYTEQDGKYCIEALVAGSDLEEQIRQELKRRNELDETHAKPRVNYEDSDERIVHRVRIQSPAILELLCKVLNELDPDIDDARVAEWKGQNRTTFYRPFAWFLHAQEGMKKELHDLEEAFGNIDEGDPAKTQTIADLVTKALEKRTLDADTNEQDNKADSGRDGDLNIQQSPDDGKNEPEHESLAKRVERDLIVPVLRRSYHTLLELRCYVDFVERRVMPQATKYDVADAPEARTVRYQDLWYLFRPGRLVYIPATPSSALTGAPARPERLGKIYSRTKPDSTAGWEWNLTACQARRKTDGTTDRDVFSFCYYQISYNGDLYRASAHPFVLYYFDGSQDVTALPAYPLAYHPEAERLLASFEDDGRKFNEAVTTKHMAYGGWSLPAIPPPPPAPTPSHAVMRPRAIMNGAPPVPMHPGVRPPAMGSESYNEGGELALKNPTYIESDVIIDAKEAIRVVPYWGYALEPWNKAHYGGHACQDTIEIIQWPDKGRKAKVRSVQDRTQVDDNIGILELNVQIRENQFMQTTREPHFEKEDFVLLPSRLYAYALRERKFFIADVRCLRRLQAETDPFDSLKIDPKHIRIVQALVSSHFQRKEMESLPDFLTFMDQDLIRGKGRGLVILLHGAPGVGKTATAEAVAVWQKKPLFVITTGDLGFTPQGVESSLSAIFRLAHLWDCILLLDEADVFLSQRETSALQRNALVSVFLRVLEYYNGILFLTTNRVGTLDEAFKSRVHLSLYYPPLDRKQTEEITLMNLNRLEIVEQQRAKVTSQKPLVIYKQQICEFSVKHWDRHAENDGAGRWNGRQIRNAVQIAASLALYENRTDKTPGAEDLPPILKADNFKTVEETMTLFEGYMTKTKGGTDSFISHTRSERYDKFRGSEHDHMRVSHVPEGSPSAGRGPGGYYPYQHRQRTPPPPQQPGSDPWVPSQQQQFQYNQTGQYASTGGYVRGNTVEGYPSAPMQHSPGGPSTSYGPAAPSVYVSPGPHSISPQNEGGYRVEHAQAPVLGPGPQAPLQISQYGSG
ncbi:hypothetical protein F4778DRAFT_235254 [Xylariomycetidae sp. FL2044]|nr:hypothetical protein F4778DRAFT_235254 [Xylariomycetidae sp. FL2044]